jgi:hypothetical protein
VPELCLARRDLGTVSCSKPRGGNVRYDQGEILYDPTQDLSYASQTGGTGQGGQRFHRDPGDPGGDEIEKIRKKADRLGAETRGKYREQIEDLRARQETARRKLEDLKRTGGEAWEDLREDKNGGGRNHVIRWRDNPTSRERKGVTVSAVTP